jgi:hypothetical protein
MENFLSLKKLMVDIHIKDILFRKNDYIAFSERVGYGPKSTNFSMNQYNMEKRLKDIIENSINRPSPRP